MTLGDFVDKTRSNFIIRVKIVFILLKVNSILDECYSYSQDLSCPWFKNDLSPPESVQVLQITTNISKFNVLFPPAAVCIYYPVLSVLSRPEHVMNAGYECQRTRVTSQGLPARAAEKNIINDVFSGVTRPGCTRPRAWMFTADGALVFSSVQQTYQH